MRLSTAGRRGQILVTFGTGIVLVKPCARCSQRHAAYSDAVLGEGVTRLGFLIYPTTG